MKAFAALLIVALLSFSGPVRAQTPGELQDAKNAAQDTAIERNAGAIASAIADLDAQAALIAERESVDAAQGAELISLKAEIVDLQQALADLIANPPTGPPTAPPDEPDVPPVDEPVPGQRWQMGVNFAAYYSHENAFINRAALFPEPPAPDEWAGYKLGIVRAQIKDAGDKKAGAEWYKGCWLLLWDGASQLKLGGAAGAQTQEGPGRRTEQFKGAETLAWVEAKTLDFSDVRFMRCEEEAAYAAGERFTEGFRKLVAFYDVVRALDWNPVNGSYINSVDELKPADAQSWAGGPPIEAQFDLAAETGAALWLPVPAMIGLPDDLRDAAIEAARLPASDTQPAWKVRQEAQLAVFARGFEPALISPEWERMAARIVAAMEAADYQRDRAFYLELGNEAWGTHFLNGIYFWGMRDAFVELTGVKPIGQPMQGPYGLFTARFACAFGRELKKAGRADQNWTMAVNSQAVWPDQTKGALTGVEAFTLCGADTQPMSRYGVAVTGYWSGGFNWNERNELFGARMSLAAWRARWLEEFAKDPEALAQRIEDYLTQDGADWITNALIVENAVKHAKIAGDFGARFIGQYEGMSHDNIDPELKKAPGVIEFAQAFMRGERTAAVIRDQSRRWGEAFPEGEAMIANYHHWGPKYDPDKPWDTAPVWDADAPVNVEILNQLSQ